jgi:protein-ribulosamine 3-kinase
MEIISNPTLNRLLNDAIRLPVEQSVSTYLGRPWRVQTVESKLDESSHPAAILADESYAIFVKLNEGALAVDQLTQEVAGLRLLTAQAGVLTPTVIDLIAVDGGALVIMAAVRVVNRQEQQWRAMGQALAQIHQVKGAFYGLTSHCYWGSLYQDNTPLPDWPAFFWQRRLFPRLQAASASGNLPLALTTAVEQVGNRLADLCGTTIQPTLLHGDAHQNNFISTAQGPVFIDPAVYYGHPEIDLAPIDFFAPASPSFFAGYADVAPIEPGFARRRHLWLLPTWLAMVEVDGPQHLSQLRGALEAVLN